MSIPRSHQHVSGFPVVRVLLCLVAVLGAAQVHARCELPNSSTLPSCGGSGLSLRDTLPAISPNQLGGDRSLLAINPSRIQNSSKRMNMRPRGDCPRVSVCATGNGQLNTGFRVIDIDMQGQEAKTILNFNLDASAQQVRSDVGSVPFVRIEFAHASSALLASLTLTAIRDSDEKMILESTAVVESDSGSTTTRQQVEIVGNPQVRVAVSSINQVTESVVVVVGNELQLYFGDVAGDLPTGVPIRPQSLIEDLALFNPISLAYGNLGATPFVDGSAPQFRLLVLDDLSIDQRRELATPTGIVGTIATDWSTEYLGAFPNVYSLNRTFNVARGSALQIAITPTIPALNSPNGTLTYNENGSVARAGFMSISRYPGDFRVDELNLPAGCDGVFVPCTQKCHTGFEAQGLLSLSFRLIGTVSNICNLQAGEQYYINIHFGGSVQPDESGAFCAGSQCAIIGGTGEF